MGRVCLSRPVMAAAHPPGLIMPAPETEAEVVPLAPQGEPAKGSGGVVEQGGTEPGGSDPARLSSATAAGSLLLKVRTRKKARKTRAAVRQGQRQADAVSLRRDKQLYPNMLEEEIIGLGRLFDEYAEENASGELHINHAAVKRMLDESLQFLYDKIDMDQSGSLDKSEVKALLDSLGHPTTRAELDRVMAEVDDDNDDKVDYREFKTWWVRRQYETEENQERELQDLFAVVDEDGSGEIDWHEFLRLIACVQLHAASLPESFLLHALASPALRCARRP